MKIGNSLSALVLATTAYFPSIAQTASGKDVTPIAASAATAVPALVPYSGAAIGSDGKPIGVDAAITFLVYKEEAGGEPLWSETQSVAVDAIGHYKVQLGATSPSGLPSNFFSTGEARWLEVQVAGEPAQPRVARERALRAEGRGRGDPGRLAGLRLCPCGSERLVQRNEWAGLPQTWLDGHEPRRDDKQPCQVFERRDDCRLASI